MAAVPFGPNTSRAPRRSSTHEVRITSAYPNVWSECRCVRKSMVKLSLPGGDAIPLGGLFGAADHACACIEKVSPSAGHGSRRAGTLRVRYGCAGPQNDHAGGFGRKQLGRQARERPHGKNSQAVNESQGVDKSFLWLGFSITIQPQRSVVAAKLLSPRFPAETFFSRLRPRPSRVNVVRSLTAIKPVSPHSDGWVITVGFKQRSRTWLPGRFASVLGFINRQARCRSSGTTNDILAPVRRLLRIRPFRDGKAGYGRHSLPLRRP